MMKRLIATLVAFLLAISPALATGPSTVQFQGNGVNIPYGVTLGAGGEYHSTTALVDINNPANGATISGGSLQVTVQNSPAVSISGTPTVILGAGSASVGTVVLGAGSASVGTVVLGAGAATIGALTANQSVNAAQIAGSAWSTAATGIPKVGVTDGSGTALTSTGSALDINLKTSAATVNTGTHTLTSSLYAAGTNGFTTTPFTVLTTELNALASAGVATSSVNGTSGVFSQTTTGNAQFGRCWITLGAALGGAASAGANFAIWFLTSTDGGTTFESQTVSPPPRQADITIPVGANAYGANAVLMSPARQPLWAESVKIVFQNNTGQAMGASGNVVKCGPEAVQY